MPSLDSRLEAKLIDEPIGDPRIRYVSTGLGVLGLHVLAFHGVSLNRLPGPDVTSAAVYLLSPLLHAVKDALRHWGDKPQKDGPCGNFEIACAGVIGEPLYYGALQALCETEEGMETLTEEDLERIGKYYCFYGHELVEQQREPAETAKRSTGQEAQALKTDRRQRTKVEPGRGIHILHLSDIHLGTESEASKHLTQLETDLRRELGVSRLGYLVISGDAASYSTPDEYKAASDLVDGLVKRFGLDASRVIIVPGNHDLNWDLVEDAYPFVPKRRLPTPLPEGRYIPAGDAGALLCDEDLYRQRFAHFNAHFYKKVYTGQEYPLDYADQGLLTFRPDDRLLFLALNSAWEIDHHYQDRASINMDALARALDQLQDSQYNDWLKIAVWHHPVTGREMMNDEFLQLLAVHGFQIIMHGHIHEAQQGFYTYDPARGIHVVGAGTFGAPLRKQAGIPLQYNLLTLDPDKRTITVETRKKEKPSGAWSADARWGAKNNPMSRYTIKLR